MQNIKRLLGTLILSLSSLAVIPPSVAENTKAYGKGKPFTLDELPPGILKQQLQQLPSTSKSRAMSWLHSFDFTELDVPYLRADDGGGIFYQDPQSVEPLDPEGSAVPALSELTEVQTFSLHSKPGAANVVFLDMDGRIVTGTIWNSNAGVDPLYMRPYNFDGNEASFSQSELNAIAETWRRIAEDFAPFDIDVTTEDPGSFGPQVGVILVTPKADQYGNDIYSCSCGGVAYVGVWGTSYYTNYQPALVFTDGVGTGPHNIAEAASHELGHNLNLSHDGTRTQGYYAGHGSGNVSWAPIMGVGYYQNVTQWSKGEYQNASQSQDDLQLIADRLAYRTDDHENANTALATPLVISGSTQVVATNPITDPDNVNPANKGVIEHRNDIDLFMLDVGSGDINLTITPAWIANFYGQSLRGMNLDIMASLYNESGSQLLGSSNVLNDTYAELNVAVNGGRYILAIEGTGYGDPLTDGYSDYGSLGQYFINGNVPASVVVTEKPPVPSDLVANLSGENEVLLTWTDPASSAENNESGYRVWRSLAGAAFSEAATIASDSDNYLDTISISGSYRYQIEAYNAIGSSSSNISNALQVDVPLVATTAVANSETNTSGSIASGSYLDTQQVSGIEELREQHQGGKPSNRVSQLEHSWTITNILAGNSVVLEVIAQAPANTENDNFLFEYAINGATFQTLGLLYQGSGSNRFSMNLPSDTQGSVTVRITDTDRTAGAGKTDSVEISYIAVTTNGDPADMPPQIVITSPSDNDIYNLGESISFMATAQDNEDGDLSANLEWSSSIDGTIGLGSNIGVNTLSLGEHLISASVTDSASNIGTASVSLSITDPAIGISLQVSANKTKGQHTPILTWSGTSATQVDIYRDGEWLVTIANSGSYTDQTGNKGSGSYRYQVCEQGGSSCSVSVTVVY
ncbi:hypothetical protein tinsulaeT_04540 [Thalassotalea insulae]|uniref:Fibronectin type-III domain-containing protein n=1 Tax=Thalassotalea insulae TaxID=2056778 RepID=A0ABQ6GNH7_9GAMM|nr:hypothetical protein [Thalassotalea insulae]GLX77114.1 hypothetical protein tinsulaeT_04540 [Thalassotalea insulae]